MTTRYQAQTLRPFYQGSDVNERLVKIRKSIDYIRRNWDRYEEFSENLKTLILVQMLQPVDGNVERGIHAMLAAKKSWKTTREEAENDNFHALRLYISPGGYANIFRLLNMVFRDDSSTDSEELIQAAVFLVELLNIDLFNYCIQYPQHANFQGVVYRGISISSTDLKQFQSITTKPVEERVVAIPLGLMSSSLDRKVAEKNASQYLLGTCHPLIMKIHVIELKPEYLIFYKNAFLSSVVSGICAVDIREVASNRVEREVILRGPFFQVLQLHHAVELSGRRCHILEMVMLNINRDHLSSVRLGDASEAAGRLFGAMVMATRYQFCIDYCRRECLAEDEAAYSRLLTEKYSLLDTLMKI